VSDSTVPLHVVVLADTHLHDDQLGRRDLPAEAWERLRHCDVILHAGDVLEAGLLRRLGELAPTYAVLGNNDTTLVDQLPETRVLDLAGVQVAMVHNSGPRQGRGPRLRRRFPTADLVVFGHSHVPWNQVGVDGQVLFNPGSPTTRRSQPTRTLGELLVAEGRIVDRTIVDLGT
jgi:putative phosphoesterase